MGKSLYKYEVNLDAIFTSPKYDLENINSWHQTFVKLMVELKEETLPDYYPLRLNETEIELTVAIGITEVALDRGLKSADYTSSHRRCSVRKGVL